MLPRVASGAEQAAPTAPSLPVGLEQYLLHELAHVRAIEAQAARETRALETYATLASGAVWSFAVLNLDAPGFLGLIWLPMIVTQLLGLRAVSIYGIMRAMRRYLVRVETRVALPEGLGWEQFFGPAPQRKTRVTTAIVFWVLLSLSNLTVAVFLTLRHLGVRIPSL